MGEGRSLQTNVFGVRTLQIQPAGVNVLQALNRAPGFNFSAGDANGFYEYGQNISMRVFNGRQLAFTIDGIPLGDQGPAGGTPAGRLVETESVQQVTVHQGSGTKETISNYGLGGAVLFTTSRPAVTRGFRSRVTVGEFMTIRGYGRVDTGELARGLTSYASASYNYFEKWRSLGDQRQLHVESKLRQEFANGSVSLNLYYNDRDDHDFLDISVETFESEGRDVGLSEAYVVMSDKVAQADANALYYDPWSNRREDILVGVNLDVRPSSTAHLIVTPYFHNQGGVGTWLPDYRPDANAANPLDAANRDQTRNTWRETQYFLDRFGVTGSLGVSLTSNTEITLGAWAEHRKRTQRRVWFDLPDQDSYNIDTIRDQVVPYWTQFDRNYTYNTYVGFLQGEMRVNDRLLINGGLTSLGYEVTFFEDLLAQHRRRRVGEPFLPQAGFVFDDAPEHQIFGSVSRRFAQAPDDAVRQSAPVSGEKAINVDLGYRFLHPGMSTSIAGYFVNYTDKIESIQLSPYDRYANETALQNVGGVTGVGMEITGDFSLGRGLGLFASANLTRSQYDGDVEDSSEAGGVLRIDGNDQVFTPKIQAFGELSHRMENGLVLAVNGKYVGMRKSSLSGPVGGDASAQEELDGYVLFGFSARYDFRNVELFLNAANLTDTKYLAATSGIGPGTSRRPGGGTYFPGSPRRITVGVGVGL